MVGLQGRSIVFGESVVVQVAPVLMQRVAVVVVLVPEREQPFEVVAVPVPGVQILLKLVVVVLQSAAVAPAVPVVKVVPVAAHILRDAAVLPACSHHIHRR